MPRDAREARIAPLLQWLQRYAARRVNSQLMDERRTIAPHIVLDFGNQGLLGMQVPKAFGGLLELNNFELLRVQRQLGAIDLTLAFFVGLNNGLGVRPILRFAQPDIKERYLPQLATGRILGAFAVSEPAAGSNPIAIEACARRTSDGFSLSGTKLWCGNAAWAGVITVFGKHVDASGKAVGHVGLCVDAETEGLRVGAEAMTMGLRGMVQNTVHLEGVQVAPNRVLGSPFSGMSVASDVMGFGRLGIAATAVGGIWRAVQLMVRYSSRRQINTGSLYAHGHTQAVLQQHLQAAQVLGTFIDAIACALDRGETVLPELHAAAKLLASEALWDAADATVQMLGGRGYCENNGAGQLLRDARITRLFEGPSESLASFIGQRAWQSDASYLDAYFEANGSTAALTTLKKLIGSMQIQAANAALVPLGYAVAWQLVAAQTGALAPGWLDAHYRAAASRAIAAAGQEALPPASALARLIKDQIGDIEQTAAGADHEVDAFLRQ